METKPDPEYVFGGSKDDKVNLCEYVALNHSLLGMFFQKKGLMLFPLGKLLFSIGTL